MKSPQTAATKQLGIFCFLPASKYDVKIVFQNYLPTYKSTFDKLTIPNHAYEYLYGMYVFEKVSCTTELHPTIILDQRWPRACIFMINLSGTDSYFAMGKSS